jgi:hypothetical protein
LGATAYRYALFDFIILQFDENVKGYFWLSFSVFAVRHVFSEFSDFHCTISKKYGIMKRSMTENATWHTTGGRK